MFDRLECSDRLAELLSLLAVVDSKLEHPFRCAQCIGGYQDRCSGGDFGDRLGRVGVEPPCRYVIQGDISGVSRAVQQRPGVKPSTHGMRPCSRSARLSTEDAAAGMRSARTANAVNSPDWHAARTKAGSSASAGTTIADCNQLADGAAA